MARSKARTRSLVTRGLVAWVAAAALVAGCHPTRGPSGAGASSAPLPVVPAGWQRLTNRAFSFSAPPDVVETPVRGVDSYVGQYDNPSLRITFDYGSYSSDSLGGHRGAPARGAFTVERTAIDGQPAILGSWTDDVPDPDAGARHGCGVFVRSDAGDHLAMTIWSRTAQADTCLAILRSIRFDGLDPR